MDDLAERVTYWANVLAPLGLQHWRITVEIVDEPEGKASADAAVNVSAYYDQATIQFAADRLEELTPEELDETIVHELIHVVNRDLWDAMTQPEYMFGKPAWSVHYDRIDHEMEGVVERVARSIVRAHRLPLLDCELPSTEEPDVPS